MQVDLIKLKLKASGTKYLKVDCDEPLSASAFKFNLRRYIQEQKPIADVLGALVSGEQVDVLVVGRGFHSSTSQFNLSAFCGTGGAVRSCFGGI